MTKMKEKLIRDRDEHQDENHKLRQQIEETRSRTANYQNELLESQNKITELTQEIQVSQIPRICCINGAAEAEWLDPACFSSTLFYYPLTRYSLLI